MPEDVSHPLFARFFDRLSRVMEKDLGRYRAELLSGLKGRVVEIGPGNGINFRHYPTSVEEVVAVEPEPYLRGKALTAAVAAPVKVTVQAGRADELPLADGSLDAAVCSLVLCSVPDPKTALAELRRVLRPGGQLRFLEHVRSRHRGKARAQRAADATVWPHLSGGCHCGRDTLSAVQAAGFTIEQVRSLDFGPAWLITNPHLLGSAIL